MARQEALQLPPCPAKSSSLAGLVNMKLLGPQALPLVLVNLIYRSLLTYQQYVWEGRRPEAGWLIPVFGSEMRETTSYEYIAVYLDVLLVLS